MREGIMKTRHWLALGSALSSALISLNAIAADDDFKRHNFAGGLFYIAPQSSADPLHTTTATTLIPALASFDSPGTNAYVRDAQTLGLTYNYFFNRNVSLEFIGGIPPRLELVGEGKVVAPFLGGIPITDLDASANKPLVKVRSWNPALNLQYHFGGPGQMIRPYVGLGVSYNKFDDYKINQNFANDLMAAGRLIGLITLNPNAANPTVDIDSSASWQPLATVGLTGEISEHWYGVFSVSYMPLDTDATVSVRDSTGKPLATSTTTIDVNPVIGFLGVGYRF